MHPCLGVGEYDGVAPGWAPAVASRARVRLRVAATAHMYPDKAG